MLIRNSLALFIAALILFISGISVYINSKIVKKNNVLLDTRLAESKREHRQARSLHNGAVFEAAKRLAIIEKSGVGSQQQHGTAIMQVLQDASLEHAWFFDSSGLGTGGYCKTEASVPPPLFFMGAAAVDTILSRAPYTFVEFIQGRYYELYADAWRDNQGKICGVVFVSKKLDDQYTAGMQSFNLTATYQLHPYKSNMQDFTMQDFGKLVHYELLQNRMHSPVYAVSVSDQIEALPLFQRFVARNLFINMGVILLCLLSLLVFSTRTIFNPLKAISEALQNRKLTPQHLRHLRSGEFSKIAMLISESFEHNRLMEAEIESRKKSEAALQNALNRVEEVHAEKLEADEANKSKSQFLSVISHEIRTPINGVIGISNLLMEEDLTPKQREYVQILNFSSRHLMSLVSDVLDFSKIETGNIEFDKSAFNLKHLCEGICFLFRPKAEEKGIQLDFKPDLSLDTHLVGDQVRIGQIITNLISNAIKFTFQGGVALSYYQRMGYGNQVHIHFVVKDTGIGMRPEELDNIFDHFTQGKGGLKYGGTGLGLAISKRLVELQGGHIQVSSAPGQGSTFTFNLQLEKNSFQKVNEGGKYTPLLRSLPGMRVLVAEDNRTNARIVEGFLKKWEVSVAFAENGKAAVDYLEKEFFDLVLMDIQMPVMNGIEATMEIKNSEQLRVNKTPIVALTADATVETQNKLMRTGFSNYLTKPFNPDALYRILQRYYEN